MGLLGGRKPGSLGVPETVFEVGSEFPPVGREIERLNVSLLSEKMEWRRSTADFGKHKQSGTPAGGSKFCRLTSRSQRFQSPLFFRLVLGLCWWMIHLFLSIHHFTTYLLQVIESYVISIGLLERYRHLQLDNLRCLAVVIDSKEAKDTRKLKKLLGWLSNIRVKYLILYDMEGVLKKSLEGDLREFSWGRTTALQQDMSIELLSFTDNKGIAKAASFLYTKYLKDELGSCIKKDPITETEMFDALKAVGCGGPDPDLLLVCGPVRCHLGFPAWKLRYTEIIHMGSLYSIKYGAILKAFYTFSKKRQNYGT